MSIFRDRCLLFLVSLMTVVPVFASDHQVFIADAGNLRVTEIDGICGGTPTPVLDVAGVLTGGGAGFDDGDHMVVHSARQRIYVSNHGSDFDAFDFALTALVLPWPALSEPLGIAPFTGASLLITDENDDCPGGLFRLSGALAITNSATGCSFDSPEGVAYDRVNRRIYVADEDDNNGEIEIFNTALVNTGTFSAGTAGSEGPYWIGVDGSCNRVFFVSESTRSATYGIHVFDISGGGDVLTFNSTIVGSGGAGSDDYGTLAVSESRDRLFAIDYTANTVDVFDTCSLSMLCSVPASRAGAVPLMVSVGAIPSAISTLSQWTMALLAGLLTLAGILAIRRRNRSPC